jgi:hypothetical protein
MTRLPHEAVQGFLANIVGVETAALEASVVRGAPTPRGSHHDVGQLIPCSAVGVLLPTEQELFGVGGGLYGVCVTGVDDRLTERLRPAIAGVGGLQA